MQLRKRWWQATDLDLSTSIFDVVRSLMDSDSDRALAHERQLEHYLNYSLASAATPEAMEKRPGFSRKAYNLTRSTVETSVIKVAKTNPRPAFLTVAGDWSKKREAQKLERFASGQYRRLQLHQKGWQLATDAALHGTGVWHFYREGGVIRCERVIPTELLVDQTEATYQAPRSLFRSKLVDREVLKAGWPDRVAVIEAAPNFSMSESPPAVQSWLSPYEQDEGGSEVSDLVQVIEAWHLPSGGGVDDGRHVVTLENDVLTAEEEQGWSRDNFPFVFLYWSPPPIGFWGDGVASKVIELDRWMNHMLARARDNARRASVPITFVEQGGITNIEEKLTNKPMTIVEYRKGLSQLPQTVIPQVVGAELMQLVQQAIEHGYEVTGNSQLTATAKKPPGLDAKVALREFNDIETERFLPQAKAYEQAVAIDAAEQILLLAKEIAEDDTLDESEKDALTSRAIDGRSVIDIRWRDIDLEQDSYVLQVYPSSSLPEHPAAKRAEIEETMQAGLLTAEEGRELMDFPDIEGFNDRKLAAQRLTDKIIEVILEEDRLILPEVYFPVSMAMPRVTLAYMQAVTDEVPEKKLQLFRDWLAAAEAVLAKQQPPPPPMAGPGPAPAPGMEPTAALPPGLPPEALAAMAGPQPML